MGTCTEHKCASCSIPRGQSGVSQQLREMCGCALGCSIAPSSTAGSQLCSRRLKGIVYCGLFRASPSSAGQMLLFLGYPLQLQPGACRGAQGLGGECRCLAQCFSWTPLSSLPCSHPRHNGRRWNAAAGVVQLLQEPKMAAPKAKPWTTAGQYKSNNPKPITGCLGCNTPKQPQTPVLPCFFCSPCRKWGSGAAKTSWEIQPPEETV